jgi:hypothetical protein
MVLQMLVVRMDFGDPPQGHRRCLKFGRDVVLPQGPRESGLPKVAAVHPKFVVVIINPDARFVVHAPTPNVAIALLAHRHTLNPLPSMTLPSSPVPPRP